MKIFIQLIAFKLQLMSVVQEIHAFLWETLFLNSASVLLKFSHKLTFKMLLRCCLIHITIILLRHILCLAYFGPCLGLGLLMSYLCNLFFIFSLFFIVIYHITSFKQTYLLSVHFLEDLLFLDGSVDEESE